MQAWGESCDVQLIAKVCVAMLTLDCTKFEQTFEYYHLHLRLGLGDGWYVEIGTWPFGEHRQETRPQAS